MSATSEEFPPTGNPNDPRYYAPRRPSERVEPRLGSLSDRPLGRAGRPETSRTLPSSAALSVKLESAVSESLRRQMEPEIVPEPIEYKRQGTRRTLIAIASGVAAALAVASVAALLFVTIYPKEEDSGQSVAAAVQAAAPGDDKSALSQFRALVNVNVNASGQNFTHEQSERLLQQFVQWRQKTVAISSKP
jgi:predicted NodU family carbamoyl transferase